MTMHIVDDVTLGRLERRIHELKSRFLNGTLPVDRVLDLLQLAIEGTPREKSRLVRDMIPLGFESVMSKVNKPKGYGYFMLECRWSWDSSHREYVTVDSEPCDPLPFDQILDPTMPIEMKEMLMRALNSLLAGMLTQSSHTRMVRLYKIEKVLDIGYSPNHGLNGKITDETVDLHFMMRPICEFDEEGLPIPCQIETLKRSQL
jgi:hypothetical protein